METYQTEQAMALARERQHHITAAARQLEALLAMEEEQANDRNTSPLDYETRVNENYIGVKLSTEEIDVNDNTEAEVEQKTKSVYFKDDTSNYDVDSRKREMYQQLQQQHQQQQQLGPSSVIRNRSNQSIAAAASVLNYSDVGGLSTELRNMLNRSTFDPSYSLLLNNDLHLEKSILNVDSTGSKHQSMYVEGDGGRSDNEQLQEKVRSS